MSKISGTVSFVIYEASRLRISTKIEHQNPYVKVKYGGHKSRTKCVATGGGSAPRWNAELNNVLTLDVDDALKAVVSVEVWDDSKVRNFEIDSVNVPLEPYLYLKGHPTPKWHKLSKQGSLLFSVEFTPGEASSEEYHRLEKTHPKRAGDPTMIEHVLKYHQADDKDSILFGSTLCIHALGERWMKYGSCFRSHIQSSKRCLQLTQTFDDKVLFKIHGEEDNSPLVYGTRFSLFECHSGKKVDLGMGTFEFIPVNPDKNKHGDPVKYGDHVYLQAFYPKTGSKLLGAEGESKHVLDSTIYIGPDSPRVTMTLTFPDGLMKAPSTPPTNSTVSLRLTTYNVWMMPDKITAFADVSPQKCERAQLIPVALPESDVVIFNEAFCHVARPILLEAMKEKGFYFETPIVGHCVGKMEAKFLDSGVAMVSRYPIQETDMIRFGGVCHGDDALADKGAVYACIVKDGRRVHVFASHTQAWTSPAAVKTRQDQFRMMRNFVDEKDIPSNEPVIFAGDFNVNKLKNAQDHEYDQMVEILESTEPQPSPEQTTEASFDADNNPLAADGPSSDGVCERLDFILTCNHHLQPSKSMIKINPIKAKEPWTWGTKGSFTDLSDHYPVTSYFEFDFSHTAPTPVQP